MRDANNERHLPITFLRPSRKGFAVLCALAAFLTFTGVYDAVLSLPFWLGWCYWMLTLVVGCGIGYLAIMGVSRVSANTYIGYGVSVLMSTAAVTFVIAMLQIIIGQPLSMGFLPFLFGQVLAISFLIFSIGIISERALSPTSSDATGQSPENHFLENLPMKYRSADLYAISSEDHYLRVHTDKGEELILMRLSDAVHALKEADGLQTHRSWWVGSSGVEKVKRDNGRMDLVLKSGIVVPVSRRYQPAVKSAGWL